MNRGVEIDCDVADGPHSVILDQVTNGVAVRMAVLYLLAGGTPELAEAAKRREASDERRPDPAPRRTRHRSVAVARRGRATCCSSDGKIEAVGRDIGAARRGAEVIDCAGMVVAPGLDRRARATCASRGRKTSRRSRPARGRGGRRLHRVCAMPNTDPVTDNQAAVGFIVRAGAARRRRRGSIRSARLGRTEGASSSPSSARWSAPGAVAVSDDGKPVAIEHLMRTALEYARTFGIPVADHCEEPTLAAGGAMHEGIVSHAARPQGDSRGGRRDHGGPRHPARAAAPAGTCTSATCRTRGSVELIRRGKDAGHQRDRRGVPAPPLADRRDAVEGYDTNAKMNPPLRDGRTTSRRSGRRLRTARST